MTDLVGTTLGQYQIVELIGEGGMAAVYKAWQPSLRRYVALKVLAPHLSGDAEFVQRFHQEAVSAANLKQSNIVTIHDVGTESGYHYIAMELVEGASLEDRIRSGQSFTSEQVVDVVSQIGAALDYAHQRGFIHRDIKPANILIEPAGRVVLTDFGIVKALSGSGVTSALTRAGTVFGTPEYMSPEQIRDEPLDHRSDLYALGIVCYEMLAGKVPFAGGTTHAILYAQVNNPPPPLRDTARLSVSPPVEAVVNKMLAKDRHNRYNSAGEFARDMAQAVSGVWPAGLGGGTVVAGPERTVPMGEAPGEMRERTVRMGETPGQQPAPTVARPAGPSWTPPPQPAAAQPVAQPAAPARRRRWPLVLGVMAAAIVAVLILGTLIGVLVLGVENPLKSVQAMLDLRRAQAALDDGDYAEAADKFGLVLENAPDNAEALDGQLEAAEKLAQDEQFDDAIAAYESVREAQPGEVRSLRGLGEAYEAKGDWAEAATWYEKWVQVEPDNRDALLALGWMEYELENYEGAIAQFKRVESLAPDWPAAYLGLGQAYLGQGDYVSGLESAERALELAPDDSPDQGQALELLHSLADVDPDAAPLLVLSDWYAGRGDNAALQQVNGQIMERISYRTKVDLGGQIRFLGSDFHEPSDGRVQVDLYFQPIAPMDADYTVWMHSRVDKEDVYLLPPDRQEYGFVGGGESYPMSSWFQGAIYRDRRVRDLAPGEYRFTFGVWLPEPEVRLGTADDPETGVVDLGWRLVGLEEADARILSHRGWRAFEGDELEQAREAFEAALAKEPEDLDALVGASATYGALGDRARLSEITDRLLPLIPNPWDVQLGDVLRFIGYEIQTLTEGRVQVDLYFQPVVPMDTDYTVWMHNHVREEDISLLPPDRQQYGFISGGESYPTSTWIEGAVYRARKVRELAPGEYSVVFGVWVPGTEIRLGTEEDPDTGAVDLGWHVVGER